MRPKQKKLNPMSDMRALTTRMSKQAWDKLLRSRLLKFQPSKKKIFGFGHSNKDRLLLSPNLSQSISLVFSPKTPKQKQAHKRFKSEINFVKKAGWQRLFFSSRFSKQTLASLSVFLTVGLLVLSVFPLLSAVEKNRKTQASVLGAATSAYNELKLAQDALLDSRFAEANFSLVEAYRGFEQARRNFLELSMLLTLAPKTREAEKLLAAAQEASLALQYFNLGLEQALKLRLTENGLEVGSEESPLDVLGQSFRALQFTASYLQNVTASLESIETDHLPADLSGQIDQIRIQLKKITPGLASFLNFQNFLSSFFANEEKKYLVLFQNYRELRATGGFIGTYGYLTVKQGKIIDLKIESIYQIDGQLHEKIAAPGPLQRTLTPTWSLRDSNWFFDFKKSAQKASYFFELETGQTIDGVFAFTPELFVKLLALTGPIEMPEYGVVLDSENFVDEVQRQTSEIYDRVLNQPKKFLAEFTPKLLNKISGLDSMSWLLFMEIILDSLNRKDILLYSSDLGQQEFYTKFNWSGEVRSTKGDYLAIVHSNVGGGKTNQDISSDLTLEVNILPDGRVKNTLKIIRAHQTGREKELPVNVDFMRIYVPKGSSLLSVVGFDQEPYYESSNSKAVSDPDLSIIDDQTLIHASSGTLIYDEYDKTVFANWVILPPNQSRTITLEYLLPFTYTIPSQDYQLYSLLLQKQPGSSPTALNYSIALPAGIEAIWGYPEARGKGIIFDIDKVWGVIFK